LVGLLVMVLLAVTVVAVPNFYGRRIAGAPLATHVPPPPVAGDCLTSISSLPRTDENAPPNLPVGYPSARFVSCAGIVVGQVMSVDLSAHKLSTATSSSYHLASSTCELDQVNYVGSIGPFDPATITTPGIAWQAAASVRSLSIGPDAYQQAAGQSWTACVGTTASLGLYRGNIKDALTSGSLPPIFASCLRSIPVPGDNEVNAEVQCTLPHLAEVLASTQIIGASASAAQLQKSCVGMAARALRTPDPTLSGKIVIGVYSVPEPLSDALPTNGESSAYLECIATAPPPHHLLGTLIGLGNTPPSVAK